MIGLNKIFLLGIFWIFAILLNSCGNDISLDSKARYSNFIISDVAQSSFMASLEIRGDEDQNATCILYFCNDSDSPGCDPLDSMLKEEMEKDGDKFSVVISGIGSPNDPGDTLTIAAQTFDGSKKGAMFTESIVLNSDVHSIAFSAGPVDGVANYPMSEFYVRLYDEDGIPVSSGSHSVVLEFSEGPSTSPTITNGSADTTNGIVVFDSVSIDKSFDAYKLKATLVSLSTNPTATSDYFKIDVLDADKFDVSGPDSIVAGETYTYMITAQDNGDNTFTSFAGNVLVEVTDETAQYSTPIVFSSDGGVEELAITFTKVPTGSHTIKVIQQTKSDVVGLKNIAVTPAALDRFYVELESSTIKSNTLSNVVVLPFDRFNNHISNYSAQTARFIVSTDAALTTLHDLYMDSSFTFNNSGEILFNNGAPSIQPKISVQTTNDGSVRPYSLAVVTMDGQFDMHGDVVWGKFNGGYTVAPKSPDIDQSSISFTFNNGVNYIADDTFENGAKVIVKLRDESNQPIDGWYPNILAVDTGDTNAYATHTTGSYVEQFDKRCLSEGVAGDYICYIKSKKAELKSIWIDQPFDKYASLPFREAHFVAGAADPLETTVEHFSIPSSPTTADLVDALNFKVTIKDEYGNISNETNPAVISFISQDSNNPLYDDGQDIGVDSTPLCTNASAGVFNCNLLTSLSGTRRIMITAPVDQTNTSIAGSNSYDAGYFVAGPATSAQSNFLWVDNLGGNASVSVMDIGTIDPYSEDCSGGLCYLVSNIALKDQYLNSVIGKTDVEVSLSEGNDLSTNCTEQSTPGEYKCKVFSSLAGDRTLTIVNPPIYKEASGGTIHFIPDQPTTTDSSITGGGAAFADGVGVNTVTVVYKDKFLNVLDANDFSDLSISPLDDSAIYLPTAANSTSCSWDGSQYDCDLTAESANTYSVCINNPATFSGHSVCTTVDFDPGSATISNTSFTVNPGPQLANGAAQFIFNIEMRDAGGNLTSSGGVPSLSVSGSGNSGDIYPLSCSSLGVGSFTCLLSSTTAETKTVYLIHPDFSLIAPFMKALGSYTFEADVATSFRIDTGADQTFSTDEICSDPVIFSVTDSNDNLTTIAGSVNLVGGADTNYFSDSNCSTPIAGPSIDISSGTVFTFYFDDNTKGPKTISLNGPSSITTSINAEISVGTASEIYIYNIITGPVSPLVTSESYSIPSIAAGVNSSLYYSGSYDQHGNYIENIDANWTVVADTDGGANIISTNPGPSLQFNAVTTGDLYIKADFVGLTSDQTGTISVINGPSTKVVIENAPDGTGDPFIVSPTLISGQVYTFYSVARDEYNNFVQNESVTWSAEDGSVIHVQSGSLSQQVFTGASSGTSDLFTISGLADSTVFDIVINPGPVVDFAFEYNNGGAWEAISGLGNLVSG